MVCRRQGKGRLKSYCLTAIICITGFIESQAQPISLAMQFPNPVRANDSNGIYFSYSNLFYFRDYEYFHDIQTGYTLFGTWQYPRITLQPNAHLRLEAGALLQKDFGDKQLDRAQPMFSIQYQQRNLRVIFGALEGNQTHGLIEPLMSYDKIIERPIEEGMQVKFANKRLKADLWLDWDLRQQEDSNFPEELTGGLSFSFRLTNPSKPLQVELPFGFVMPHKGGELDTNNSIVSTVFNKSVGIAATWNNPHSGSALRSVKADVHRAFYTLQQDQNVYPYTSGFGWLANLKLLSKWDASITGTYWEGHRFIAPRGGKIYQSVTSIVNQQHEQPIRQLFFLNFMYEGEMLPGFYLDARYTPYWDLKGGFMENAFLILLSYRTNFRISRLHKG
jgi:hypothetical protein